MIVLGIDVRRSFVVFFGGKEKEGKKEKIEKRFVMA